MEKDDIEILVALIEGNEQFLQMLVDSGMSWWVSSVAFCAAVVVAVWMNRDSVVDLYASHKIAYQAFMSLVLMFFLSVDGYGAWLLRSVIGIKDQLFSLMTIADSGFEYAYFEFTSIRVAFTIGTSSFVILSIIWIVAWIAVSKYLADKQAESTSRSNDA